MLLRHHSPIVAQRGPHGDRAEMQTFRLSTEHVQKGELLESVASLMPIYVDTAVVFDGKMPSTRVVGVFR